MIFFNSKKVQSSIVVEKANKFYNAAGVEMMDEQIKKKERRKKEKQSDKEEKKEEVKNSHGGILVQKKFTWLFLKQIMHSSYY